MIKKISLLFLTVLIFLILWNWSLLGYGIQQGIGQFKIVWQARPIQEVLEDPTFPDSLKAKLLIIGEIRRFAIDSLGLEDTENYTKLYDQKGEEIMWVITASEPFQLKPKLWHFPIVGAVPYKGFFDKNEAKLLKENLEKEGWDVGIRNPGAWSTLGWFNDPILTGMLEDSDGGLASTIIHEMVHATLWVKDSVDFNENLASFIADTAAYDFLASKYGSSSNQYLSYRNSERDYRKYSGHMLRGATVLDSLYTTLSIKDSTEVKREKKKQMITNIVNSLDTLSLLRVKTPSKRFSKRLPNNSYFMGFRHYHAKLPTFKKEFDARFKGDIRTYVKFLSLKHPVN